MLLGGEALAGAVLRSGTRHYRISQVSRFAGSSRILSRPVAQYTRSRFASFTCLTTPSASSLATARWAVVNATFKRAAAPLVVQNGLSASKSRRRTAAGRPVSIVLARHLVSNALIRVARRSE